MNTTVSRLRRALPATLIAPAVVLTTDRADGAAGFAYDTGLVRPSGY